MIFHVDVNSAYLSWESVKRIKEGGEDLRLIPSCVGGDPKTRRGIVLAKSVPAKKYGVKTGEPLTAAIRKCPGIVIAKPDFKLYSVCSKAFKDILREYAPVVEEFSIDECFLDFTGTEKIYPDFTALAHEIKDRIKNELGFTVNVGIGRNKLSAKMASDFEKPDKVHTLFPEEIEEKLWKLPVGELLFIGGATAAKLRSLYIETIGDLAKTDIGFLKHYFGEKAALQMKNYANGIDESPVLAEPPRPKGYSNSITLEEDITELSGANAVLLALADSVTAHMRSDGAKAYCVAVTIRYLDFKTKSHQRSCDTPVNTTNEVYRISKELLPELWKDKKPLRLLGISLTNLSFGEESEQMSLFDEGSGEKIKRDERLDKTVDKLRQKFGFDKIKRGTVLSAGINTARKFKDSEDSKTEGDKQ